MYTQTFTETKKKCKMIEKAKQQKKKGHKLLLADGSFKHNEYKYLIHFKFFLYIFSNFFKCYIYWIIY